VAFFPLLSAEAFTDFEHTTGPDLHFVVAMVCTFAARGRGVRLDLSIPGCFAARRVAAAVLDAAHITFFMYHTGEYGTPLYIRLLCGSSSATASATASRNCTTPRAQHRRFGPRHCCERLLGSEPILGIDAGGYEPCCRCNVGTLVKRLFVGAPRRGREPGKPDSCSTVSHEMRTPLNAIVGMNDLLRDTNLKLGAGRMVKAMHEARNPCSKLNPRTFSKFKIEAGKAISKKPISTCMPDQRTSGVLAAAGEIRGLQFRAHVMPEVPHPPARRSLSLRQVLYNLIGTHQVHPVRSVT